jgi:hypothetical protein
MLRRYVKLALVLAGLSTALAVAGPASAAPTTPQLDPIPYWVMAPSLNVTWSPSAFDRGSIFGLYNLQVRDLTLGTTKESVWLQGTSYKIQGLVAAHKYGLRLRAAESDGSTLTYSTSSVDVFLVVPNLAEIQPIYYEFIEWPPPPDCPMCGLFELFSDDPVVYESLKQTRVMDGELLKGVIVDARGGVSAVYG